MILVSAPFLVKLKNFLKNVYLKVFVFIHDFFFVLKKMKKSEKMKKFDMCFVKKMPFFAIF